MKKIISFVLALAIVLCLIGCGASTTSSPETIDDSSENETSPELQTEVEEIEEETEEEIEPAPIANSDTLITSINNLADRYQQALNLIDDNFKVSLLGQSTSKISGSLLVNNKVVGLISFYGADGNAIGGKGDTENSIHQITVTCLTVDSAGNIDYNNQDTYQQGVAIPALMMAIDSSLSYDDAWEKMNEIVESGVAQEINGVTYIWMALTSGAPNLKSLVVVVGD